MIVNYKTAKTTQPFPGITRKVLANSQKVMLTEHTLEKDSVLPNHNHTHEQLVFVRSGELIIEMNDSKQIITDGDSLVIPSNVYHKVTALKKSVVMDIFVPTREDYL